MHDTAPGKKDGGDRRTMPPAGVTPIPISPRIRNLLLLATVVLLVLLFTWAPSLLPLLLGGATLALILSFPVRLLTYVMPRWVAIAIVIVALLVLVVYALVVLVPLLIRQLGELIAATPQFAIDAEDFFRRLLQPLAERGLLPAEPDVLIASAEKELLDRAQSLGQSALNSVFGILTGAFGTILLLVGVLFVTIYLLADIRRFETAYLRAVPARYHLDAQALWDEMGRSLSRYLGGLLTSLAIQGVLAYVILTFLGMPYAFLLALWTSATGILPYIGAFLGAIPAVIIALFISPLTALLVAGAYLLINQLEGNFLTPRIQGEAVKVHPLIVFLTVIAGGEVGGLLGAAFAVPLLAVVRVLFDFFAARLSVQQPVQPPLRVEAVVSPGAGTGGGSVSAAGVDQPSDDAAAGNEVLSGPALPRREPPRTTGEDESDHRGA
ncbi:MAG: AI-2E family transporter [Chloroflexi bacterium]|nr:AI-2E family transporter [Chloroflexota bacterium]